MAKIAYRQSDDAFLLGSVSLGIKPLSSKLPIEPLTVCSPPGFWHRAGWHPISKTFVAEGPSVPGGESSLTNVYAWKMLKEAEVPEAIG